MIRIQYKSGYKHQLYKDYVTDVSLRPKNDIKTRYIDLNTEGELRIRQGYSWDGASSIAIDTKTFMRGSLVHDALYQLMRKQEINHETYRDLADQELQRMCLEDGMNKIRAWWVYHAVSKFGAKSAKSKNARKVYLAPNR